MHEVPIFYEALFEVLYFAVVLNSICLFRPAGIDYLEERDRSVSVGAGERPAYILLSALQAGSGVPLSPSHLPCPHSQMNV